MIDESAPAMITMRLDSFERALLAASGADRNGDRTDDRSAMWMGRLIGKAEARSHEFEIACEAVTGIGLLPSVVAFDSIHWALMNMVGPDGRFRWHQSPVTSERLTIVEFLRKIARESCAEGDSRHADFVDGLADCVASGKHWEERP